MDNTVSEAAVLQALRAVQDPDLRRDIVALGFVKNMKICGGTVAFDIELTTPACPVKGLMQRQAQDAVKVLPGVETVNINMTAQVRQAPTRAASGIGAGMAQVKNIIAIASGKGGVGKSTIATNLAVALSLSGAKVGLMDADVYGPSVPKMFGNSTRPQLVDKPGNVQMLKPILQHGVHFMSMGLLTGPETPVIWRGPMATKLVQQFLSQVEWGELDYLLVDLPPGTGDVQLTLTQAAPLSGAVVVTTPQEVAVGITVRGLRMFEQVQVPVLGIIENMSGFACPHCHAVTDIFQKGGGERAATELSVAYLGAVPLDPAATAAGDAGTPVVIATPTSPSAQAILKIAGAVAQQISIVNERTRSQSFSVKEVLSKDGMIKLVWSDGHESLLAPQTLRLKCPCAICVDEWTGKPLLDPQRVPADVHPVECTHVGRYALQFKWSDGHQTGIYPYNKLRALDVTAPAQTSEASL